VANTYIALRTAEERIRIARENVDIQEQTLKIVEARFTYGTVTQLDVEQARTVLFNTLATVPHWRRSGARRATLSASCSACRRTI
jgi:outer membrane protein TolC